MKYIFMLILMLLFNLVANAQDNNNDAAQIKKQMAAIRKSTNWNDPDAAKEANTKIEELAVKLTQAIRNSKPPAQHPQEQEQIDAETQAEIQQQNDDYNNKLWNQMMNIVREGGSWDLAKPLREEIVEEYKEDENPEVKNQEWLRSMSFLLINMSLPQVQVIIDQMPLFRGIKTLIITTDKPVANVNLDEILNNAKGYALEELYIINFGAGLSNLPSTVSDFPDLKVLGIYNNNLTYLPAWVSKLSFLSSLQIQNNPINSIISVVSPLENLKQLGIAITQISDPEINQIHQALPECEIIRE